MQKTSKTKSKGKVVNNKKNNKKNNSKKLSLVIIIVGIILIITGIGGYLLSNKGLPGGGFNIMKPQPADGGCRVSNCTNCKPNNSNYCLTCKSGYTQSNGKCVPICNKSNCAKCSSPNYCSQCKSGYVLANGNCYLKDEGCYRCGNASGGTYTWSQYNPNTSSCSKVNKSKSDCKGNTNAECGITGCIQCSSGKCTKCADKYTLKSGKCDEKPRVVVTINVSNGTGSTTQYVNNGGNVRISFSCNRNPNYESYGVACKYVNSSGGPIISYVYDKEVPSPFDIKNIQDDVRCNINCVPVYSCHCKCNLKTYGGTCTRDGASYSKLSDCNQSCSPAVSGATAKCIETGTSRYTCRTYKQLSKQKEASCAKVLDSRWNGSLNLEHKTVDITYKYKTCTEVCKAYFGTKAVDGRCQKTYDD